MIMKPDFHKQTPKLNPVNSYPQNLWDKNKRGRSLFTTKSAAAQLALLRYKLLWALNLPLTFKPCPPVCNHISRAVPVA